VFYQVGTVKKVFRNNILKCEILFIVLAHCDNSCGGVNQLT